jgi:hypothetical protein
MSLDGSLWNVFLASALENGLIQYEKPELGFGFKEDYQTRFYISLTSTSQAKQTLMKVLDHATGISYIHNHGKYSLNDGYGDVMSYFLNLIAPMSEIGGFALETNGIVTWDHITIPDGQDILGYIGEKNARKLKENSYARKQSEKL